MTESPSVSLSSVLSLDLDRIPVDASATYEMVGVYSFGRGLFHKGTIAGSNTSYKVFYRLRSEHVVMSQLFGWEGALALSSPDFEGRYVSPQFPTFTCHEGLDREYLGWYLHRPSVWEELSSRTKGMGDRRRTLNPDALLSLSIPLPPPEDQRRIASTLTRMVAFIQEARTLRQESVEAGEVLYRSLIFSDPEDTSVLTPMHALVTLRDSDVVVDRSSMYHFAGVYSFGRGIFPSGSKQGMAFSYDRLTRLRAGDFVYPKLMAWEGAFGVVPPNCDGLVVSPEFPVFSIDQSRVLPEVLDVYFRSPTVWPLVAGASTGTNVRRRRLHPRAFLSLEIPLPSMEAQLRLRAVKSKLSEAQMLQSETGKQLDALLPSILDRAFKAKL